MADRFFPYDFDTRYAWIWRPLGARPKVDGVTITSAGIFIATYGRFRVETPVSNIKEVQRTGPYKWWKGVGLRGSLADSGITFSTTPRGGVCVLFKNRIPAVLLTGRRHAGLTVTVADRDGLVEALAGKSGIR